MWRSSSASTAGPSAEETERADAQHENRDLTFWHEDDGTVVLHGRFLHEMGARILSALDAAMAAHAASSLRLGGTMNSTRLLLPQTSHVGRLHKSRVAPAQRPMPVLGNLSPRTGGKTRRCS